MSSFLDPAILFFLLGALAALLRSNLEIPPPIARFLSLYLLMALGLKGGFALSKTGLTWEVTAGLGCAVLMAVVVPLVGYRLLRLWLNPFDAAAVAATYGSVSAVTFMTATQFLESLGIAYGGHMAAAMALMESPAIIIAVALSAFARQSVGSQAGTAPQGVSVGKLLHEAFTDGTQLLLLGAMAVGLASGAEGQASMKPFVGDLFKGLLSFFLLDMGIQAARRIGDLKGKPKWLLAYAVLAPLVHASVALALGTMAGMTVGDTTLLMVLSASASYIAVPAVVKHAIPEANPSLYIGLSLGLTFPLNILVGIPLYHAMAASVFARAAF